MSKYVSMLNTRSDIIVYIFLNIQVNVLWLLFVLPLNTHTTYIPLRKNHKANRSHLLHLWPQALQMRKMYISNILY